MSEKWNCCLRTIGIGICGDGGQPLQNYRKTGRVFVIYLITPQVNSKCKSSKMWMVRLQCQPSTHVIITCRSIQLGLLTMRNWLKTLIINSMHIKTLSTGIAFGLDSLFSASCIVTSKASSEEHTSELQ